MSHGFDCVVLNACYSQRQAKAIAKHVDCVIGMSKGITDAAAIDFSAAFYAALADGESIQRAYESGCVEISLGIEQHKEKNTPKLIALNCDPNHVIL